MADSISFKPSSSLHLRPNSPTLAPNSVPVTTGTSGDTNASKRLVNLQLENHWTSLLKPHESGNFSFTPVQLEAGASEYGPGSLRSEAILGQSQWRKDFSVGKFEISPYAGGAVHLRHTFNPKNNYSGEAFQPNFAGVRLGTGVEVSHPLKAGWKASASSEVGVEARFSNLKPMPYSLTTVGLEKSKRVGSGEVTFGVGVQHVTTPLTPSSITPMASVSYTFR